MCQIHRFIRVKVGFGIKKKRKRKMLLLASLYVFITQCNKLYFQYSCPRHSLCFRLKVEAK